MVRLGVDAVCWHARMAAGEASFADVVDEAAAAGAAYVQTTLDYLERAPGGPEAMLEAAQARGLELGVNGGAIGRAAAGADLARAVAAVEGWAAGAAALGSPDLMLYSGTYRPELAGNPGAIAAELEFLGAVLAGAAGAASELGVRLLLENASDFTAAELLVALGAVPGSGVGAFLDLTNPYNVWDDPVEAIRQLAPLAPRGHVKDFVLESLWSADGHHRRGFSVLFRYPGEGVVELSPVLTALVEGTRGRDFRLAIEGLDSAAGVRDQPRRVAASLATLRRLLPAETARPEA